MSGADKIGSDGVSRFSGGFRLEDLREGFFAAVSREHRFGTDAFLLADFAYPRKKDIAADLCSGNGSDSNDDGNRAGQGGASGAGDKPMTESDWERLANESISE